MPAPVPVPAALEPSPGPRHSGSFKGRNSSFFPVPWASAEPCPCRVPAGCLPGKFSLFLGELSVASR